uniref:Uncharacterized protein n=1 Tax=Rhizophora mucronata TaxID=61149 RepID=A0A2P2Q830_RHIMU
MASNKILILNVYIILVLSISFVPLHDKRSNSQEIEGNKEQHSLLFSPGCIQKKARKPPVAS